MAKTIVGLYDTETDARRAVDELRNNGFDEDRIHIEAHGAGESRFTRHREGDLLDALHEAGVPQEDAEFYAEGVRRGGSLLIAEAVDDRADRAARLMNVHGPVRRAKREAAWREHGYTGYDPQAGSYTTEEAEAERARYRTAPEEEEEVHLTEAREEMRVGKREVESGGARIHKRVKERPVEETVTLREEEVDVERRSTSETTTDPERAFEEETIEMTETKEEPVVEKETYVEGEVVARKKSRQRSETVRETVRETEIEVEEAGEGFEEHAEDFRRHFETNYAETGADYESYEPAYQFGYAYGSHEDYVGHNFKRAESQLRRDYERRHGKGTFDRVKGAVRHGFQLRTS